MTKSVPSLTQPQIYRQENLNDKEDLKFIQSLFNQPYMLTNPEMFRYRTKIYLPHVSGINYVGLLIGPKGTYQKRLEEQTGCKILIRGKNSHKEGYPPQPDDHEEQHILILSDQEEKIWKAKELVDRILHSDEQTRHQIRLEQLQAAQELSKQYYSVPIEDHLLTPYGPPSPHAYIIPVPNECVGLIIGKGGETIRYLQLKSGARIQVAKKQIPNSNMRNVFIEGSLEKYDKARKMIEDIVEEHRKMHQNFQSLIAGTHPTIQQFQSSQASNENSKELNSCSPNSQSNTQATQNFHQSGKRSSHAKHNNEFVHMNDQSKPSLIPQIPLHPIYQQPIPGYCQTIPNEQQKKAFLFHQEQQIQMQKQLEINPFPGPHTYVSIPNALTAFVIGHNGEKVKKLHQITGAYIFIPKDFNILTDERIIQLSGNDKSVLMCREEIKKIVKEIAPLIGIDLQEFKATKKVVQENFQKLMNAQMEKKREKQKLGEEVEMDTEYSLKDLIKNEQIDMSQFPIFNYFANENKENNKQMPQNYLQSYQFISQQLLSPNSQALFNNDQAMQIDSRVNWLNPQQTLEDHKENQDMAQAL